jgi:hypothetical protein
MRACDGHAILGRETVAMGAGVRKTLSVVAIYAVALHAILWAFAGHFANAAPGVDPFSVICHSAASDAGADGRGTAPSGGHLPSQACDHCNLCSAVMPPPIPDVVLLGRMAPVRILDVLRPVELGPRDGRSSDPKLARGPPQPM